MVNSNFKKRASVYLMIDVVSLGLIAVALTAGGVASLIGCRLDEDGANCLMGDFLASMFVLGWLSLIKIPLGAFVFIGAIIVNFFRISRAREGISPDHDKHIRTVCANAQAGFQFPRPDQSPIILGGPMPCISYTIRGDHGSSRATRLL